MTILPLLLPIPVIILQTNVEAVCRPNLAHHPCLTTPSILYSPHGPSHIFPREESGSTPRETVSGWCRLRSNRTLHVGGRVGPTSGQMTRKSGRSTKWTRRKYRLGGMISISQEGNGS